MASKLYVGNGTATPSIVIEKQVPMPRSITYGVDADGEIQYPTFTDGIINFDGVKTILYKNYFFAYLFYNNRNVLGVSFSDLTSIVGNMCCYYMFHGCSNLVSINFPKLKAIGRTGYDYSYSCYYMFKNCTNLTSADLSSIAGIYGSTAFGYIFEGCSKLTSVDLSGLTQLEGTSIFSNAFSGCSKLTSIDLSNLAILNGNSYRTAEAFSYTFSSCTSLTEMRFPKLNKIPHNTVFNYCFRNCSALKNVYFNSLDSKSFGSCTNQFNNMLSGCSNVTVHFPSNLQSVMGSWSDVQSGFGGTTCVALFDLPATE